MTTSEHIREQIQAFGKDVVASRAAAAALSEGRDNSPGQAQYVAFDVRAYSEADPLPIQFKTTGDPVDHARVRRFVSSTDSLDSYEEVILPSGWRFNRFALNPVMMQFHNYGQWPVGRVIGAKVTPTALILDAEFDPAQIDADAETIVSKIDHGSLRAGSVGFDPISWVSRHQGAANEEQRQYLDAYPRARQIYIEQELIEWTICPIGACPDALVANMRKRQLLASRALDGGSPNAATATDRDEAIAERLENIKRALAR